MVATTLRGRLLYACVAPFLLLSFIRPSDASFAFEIDPGTEECYLIHTPATGGSIITGNFDVMDDGVDADAFTMVIIDYESGETLFQPPADAREGTFKLENVKPSHQYELCFQNTSTEDDDEGSFNVGFAVRVTAPPRTLDPEEIGPDAQRALQLVQSSSAILEDWESLVDHFDFLRNREGIHQDMNDAILYRIQRWTIIEALLVMGMATGQVLYWKKFFETRRYL